MIILFCADPINPRKVDYDYESELEVCKQNEINTGLINLEELLAGHPDRAVSRIASLDNEEIAIYRGWMLSPRNYTNLYDALNEKNIRLINDPDQYVYCHYLPKCYPLIRQFTPKTVKYDIYAVSDLINGINGLRFAFGNSPVVIKDYVKSCKHQWEDACYIPDASDKQNVARVINNFLKARGDDFEGGLLVREFIELDFLGLHPKSNMPLTMEYRLFFLNNKLLQIMNYWDEHEYNVEPPEIEGLDFYGITQEIPSNFYTMDIARVKDGKWWIIELGDGQVSGLPYNADLDKFFGEIKHGLNGVK